MLAGPPDLGLDELEQLRVLLSLHQLDSRMGPPKKKLTRNLPATVARTYGEDGVAAYGEGALVSQDCRSKQPEGSHARTPGLFCVRGRSLSRVGRVGVDVGAGLYVHRVHLLAVCGPACAPLKQGGQGRTAQGARGARRLRPSNQAASPSAALSSTPLIRPQRPCKLRGGGQTGACAAHIHCRPLAPASTLQGTRTRGGEGTHMK